MRALRLILGAGALMLAMVGGAQAQSCQSIGTLPGLIYGDNGSGTCRSAIVTDANALKVTGTVTPSGTGDVNLVGINGVAPVTGQGSDTAALRVVANNPIGITPTDRTITSATGASQTVMAANAARHSLIIQNTSASSNCGVNPTGGTAVIGGAGTLTLFPGGSYQPRIPTLSAVTAICTAAQPLYAEEN